MKIHEIIDKSKEESNKKKKMIIKRKKNDVIHLDTKNKFQRKVDVEKR